MSAASRQPEVSIILPSYQRSDLIARAIASVLAQTCSDFELVVVDDGSTDDTADVVASFADPRIRFLPLARNRGAAAARNIGIQQSSAPFLAFQDSDDEWMPHKLASQLAAFEACPDDVGVVYADMERIQEDGSTSYFGAPEVLRGRLLDPETGFYQVCNLGIQSTLIRRECLEAVGGFNEAFPALEDLELFVRLSTHYGFHHLHEPLVRYHETDGLSRDVPAKAKARKLLLELYEGDLARVDPAFIPRERKVIASMLARAQRSQGA